MIYFDNGSTSHPKAPGVAQSVKDILEQGCFNINRGGYSKAYEMSDLVFDTREKIAALFGCPSSRQVVFTGGLTQALNIALKGLLVPGDHVITTQMDHNAVFRPLNQLQAQGVKVDIARCNPEGLLDISDLKGKIDDNAKSGSTKNNSTKNNKTKLVVMTHASNVCGSILPIAEVGKICRKHGILLMVDSAQTAGIVPISMARDNIDIIAFTGHKSLLAAQGLGGLILSQEIAEKMYPLITGGTGSYSHLPEIPLELPDRLEAGTLNLPGIVALSAALDYIKETGPQNIYNREMTLHNRLYKGIMNIPGLEILGPKNTADKCAIIALNFPNLDNAAVAATLDEKYGIMARCGLHCAPEAHKALGTFPHGALRFSIGHQNTEAEVDELIEVLKREIPNKKGDNDN